MITGATRLAAVIGSPIRHSLSPTILNAAFAATGADWAFVALEVADGQGAAAVDAARTLGFGGLSVTMPHKAAACGAVDATTGVAAELGAVNCVYRDGADFVGDNTDGDGFLDGLRRDPGLDVSGLRCVVLGAGGAGRAVVRALSTAGAADVAVLNRTPERAVRAAALAGSAGRIGGTADVAAADLVVNATSLGMVRGDPLPVDPELLHAGQIVADLVYHPAVTPLLGEARARGATAVGGLGMLVHQAAHAYRRWTGGDPPIDAMTTAARHALGRRQTPG